jgi:hypothetical protein
MSDEMNAAELEQEIKSYERTHGFSSDQLLVMQETGNLPDTYEIQDWLTLLKYRNKD